MSKLVLKKNQFKILINKLWPIHRTIIGPGFNKSLKIIKNYLPSLKVKKIPTGTKVFDWKIPEEWHIKQAYIIDDEGNEVCNIKDNNLHVVQHSMPINKKVSKQVLLNHCHSLPNQPEFIPYVTSYYKKYWGFCLAHNKKIKLNKKSYYVKIDSFFKSGYLNYGELIIQGKSKKTVLLSTYLCHPSMANNELSGPILAMEIANYLSSKDNLYTYRIIFIPETIGSLAFLSKNKEMLSDIFCGFNLSCVGDNGSFSYIPSRDGNTVSDRAALETLKNEKIKFTHYSWLDRGSDERQYCAPGIDLPVCSILKTKYGEYPEYHTSEDKFDKVVTLKGLLDSYKLYKKLISNIEKKYFPISNTLGEPFMSKYNLYDTLSVKRSNKNTRLMMNIISYCDGKNSLQDIALHTNSDERKVWKLIQVLVQKKIVSLY